jgi:hypothetical protein
MKALLPKNHYSKLTGRQSWKEEGSTYVLPSFMLKRKIPLP